MLLNFRISYMHNRQHTFKFLGLRLWVSPPGLSRLGLILLPRCAMVYLFSMRVRLSSSQERFAWPLLPGSGTNHSSAMSRSGVPSARSAGGKCERSCAAAWGGRGITYPTGGKFDTGNALPQCVNVAIYTVHIVGQCLLQLETGTRASFSLIRSIWHSTVGRAVALPDTESSRMANCTCREKVVALSEVFASQQIAAAEARAARKCRARKDDPGWEQMSATSLLSATSPASREMAGDPAGTSPDSIICLMAAHADSATAIATASPERVLLIGTRSCRRGKMAASGSFRLAMWLCVNCFRLSSAADVPSPVEQGANSVISNWACAPNRGCARRDGGLDSIYMHVEIQYVPAEGQGGGWGGST